MISTQRQGHFRAYLQRLVNLHTNPVAQLPPWRHPLVGYVVGPLLVGLGLGVGVVETHLLLPFSFPGVPLLFAIVLVALLWGAGPAIFAMLLSLLVLDYWYVPPFGTLGAYGWSGMLQLLTFASASIIIALLTNQREVARVRALVAEREAVLRANQLEATFEAMNDGMVVYTRQGQLLHTNAAIRRLFGLGTLPSNDEVRLRQELLLQAVQRDEQGQLLSEKQRPLSRLLAGEVLTGTQATDVCVQTPDERQVILNMSGAPIRNEAGTIERAVLIFRDVTARCRLEQRTSEALRALLALAEVLIQFPERLQRDEETTFLSDTARVGQRVVELTQSVVESVHVVMLAVESEEEIVRPLASVGLTPQEEQQWWERLTTAPFLSDHVGSHTLLSHLKDGEVLILEGMTLPFYTAALPYYVRTVLVAPIRIEKRLVGVLCVDDGSRGHTYTSHEMILMRTIAGLAALILAQAQLQREHAEARANELALREAHRRMEEFLSIICHELKTPLTIMRGSLQLAERKVKRLVSSEALLPDEMRRFAPILALLERASNQVSIQDRLVNDLLDASRIQAQTLQLLMTPCNLVSIVQEAVEDQLQIVPVRAIHLETPAGKDVPVYGDADRLVQVVTNYLTNALKYSSADRPVEVRLHTDGHSAQVSVRDEGPGLPSAEHERIWERFYRVPGMEVHSGSGVGLGVGLHVCRTIIERHGGQVGVDSRPGEGSTFWFTLRLAKHGSMDEETVV
jgi:PAS domain S-box-containing protein